jgi:hypothetical protein
MPIRLLGNSHDSTKSAEPTQHYTSHVNTRLDSRLTRFDRHLLLVNDVGNREKLRFTTVLKKVEPTPLLPKSSFHIIFNNRAYPPHLATKLVVVPCVKKISAPEIDECSTIGTKYLHINDALNHKV